MTVNAAGQEIAKNAVKAVVGIGFVATTSWGCGTLLGGYLVYEGGARILPHLAGVGKNWNLDDLVLGVWNQVIPQSILARKAGVAVIGALAGHAVANLTGGGWAFPLLGALVGYVSQDIALNSPQARRLGPVPGPVRFADVNALDSRAPSPSLFDMRLPVPIGTGRETFSTIGRFYDSLAQQYDPRQSMLFAMQEAFTKNPDLSRRRELLEHAHHPDFQDDELRGIVLEAFRRAQQPQESIRPRSGSDRLLGSPARPTRSSSTAPEAETRRPGHYN